MSSLTRPAPATGRPLRVLLVVHELSRTGAPRVALTAARGFGPEASLRIVAGRGGPLAAEAARLGQVFLLRREGPGETPPRSGRAIAGFILEAIRARIRARILRLRLGGWRPEVVLVVSAAALPTLRLVGAFGAPVVLHVDETGFALGEYQHSLTGGLTEGIARFVAVSEVVRCDLATLGVPAKRMVVIHPSVEVPPADLRAADRRATPTDGRPILVGGIGNLSWTKGAELWLLAAAALRDRLGRGRVRFRWIGVRENEAGRQFLAMVDKLDLAPDMETVGEAPEVWTHLREMDVLVVSSWEESASLVVLEAMAAGTAVAAFAGSGGPAELLGECGLVVDRFSPDRLAATVADALERPTELARMRAAAAERVRTRHDGTTQSGLLLAELRLGAMVSRPTTGSAAGD